MVKALGALLRAAISAGLIAGLAAAIFHSVLAEPVIERALALEAQSSRAPGTSLATPVVSRSVQRGGLVVGLLLYGAAWGLLFGLAYYLVAGRLSARTPARRVWLTAALLGWSVAIFPFVKYPANPPGVGAADTIGYRQGLYISFVLLSMVGAAAAVLGEARLRQAKRVGPGTASLAALVLYGVYASLLYVAMPANPDPVRMPSAIVWPFRAVSLAGLILFWTVLGGAFRWLFAERRRSVGAA